MSHDEFLIEIARAEVLTQSTMKIGTAEIYFERFRGWPIDEFSAAVKGACESGNRFPSAAAIIANRPSRKTKELERIKVDERRFGRVTSASDGLSSVGPSHAIPPELAELSDEQVRAIFQRFADSLGKWYNEDMLNYHLSMFRHGNLLWVETVRELV